MDFSLQFTVERFAYLFPTLKLIVTILDVRAQFDRNILQKLLFTCSLEKNIQYLFQEIRQFINYLIIPFFQMKHNYKQRSIENLQLD